jgi:CheY-like chemotaxis protein
MSMQRFTTPATILVIEDYPDSCEMLKVLLESLDYRVITAGNGNKALALAAREHIDLILTDFELPDMDGVTLVRLLRELNDHLRGIPVIMLTARDGDEHRNSAIQAGCTAFLGKPLDFDELQSRIETFLGQYDDWSMAG